MPDLAKRKYIENFMIKFTYNSNRIEGSKITLKETARLLQEGITPKSKPLRDIKETEAEILVEVQEESRDEMSDSKYELLNTNVEKEILEKYKQASGKELSDYLEITDRATRKQLANMLNKKILTKVGKPPKVFYLLKTEEKESVDTDIDDNTKDFIEKNYLFISPAGEIKKGWVQPSPYLFGSRLINFYQSYRISSPNRLHAALQVCMRHGGYQP